MRATLRVTGHAPVGINIATGCLPRVGEMLYLDDAIGSMKEGIWVEVDIVQHRIANPKKPGIRVVEIFGTEAKL